ncbi:MAG: HD domain-containing protein [Solirubrobacteraceae bacterium]
MLDERVLHRRLNTEIARFEDVHAPFTLLLVEVGGDDDELARRRALRAVAAALAGACRNDDPIYRNGAEGFAVLLQGSAGAATKAVKGRAEQAVHGLELDVHLSFALAEWPYDGPSRDRFFARARDGRADARAILASPRAAAHPGVGAWHGEIASVRALLATLVARDGHTSGHSEKVVSLASDLARSLSLAEREIDEIEQVALLHDLGKIGIPDSILGKAGPLNTTEWEIMREHPEIGAQIVRRPAEPRPPRAAHPGCARALGRARLSIWARPRPGSASQPHHPRLRRLPAMTSDARTAVRCPSPTCFASSSANAGSQFDPSVVACLLRVLERKRHGVPVLANRRTGTSRWRAYVA